MTEDEKKREYDDPEQSARFIKVAKEIQAEDADERFEEAMEQIAAAAKRKKAEQQDEDRKL